MPDTQDLPDQTSPLKRAVIQRFGRWWLFQIALILFGLAYLHVGHLLLTQTNHTDKDIMGGDQKNNLQQALRTVPDLTPDFSKGVSQPIKDFFPRRTDGVVNPLWPWMAAWMAAPGQVPSGDVEVTAADRALFERGRTFHLHWTLGFLVIAGLVWARSFSVIATLNAVLLAGFGAFLPRAAFFQPEPVFFALFLCTWIACQSALDRNSLWIYSVIGVVGGLAYLAKGSVEPLLKVFVAVSTLRWAWGQWQMRWGKVAVTSRWVVRNHWLGLMLLVGCYSMTAGPRLAYSAQHFGSPFHSFPGYWLWFDDFPSAYQWMGEHNRKETLEAMTPAERPSFAKYKAEHSTDQMVQRLVDGTGAKLREFLAPKTTLRNTREAKPWKGVLEWRGWYLGAVFAILLSLVLLLKFATPPPLHEAAQLHPESWTKVLFVVGAFAGFSLAYGWYTPIGKGDRFMLSLYAPLVLSFVWASESVLRRIHRRNGPRWITHAYYSAHGLLTLAIVWRVVEIYRHPVFLID